MQLPARNELSQSKWKAFFVWMALALTACTTTPERTGVHAQASLVGCLQSQNPIQCENAQQGDSNWTLTVPADKRTLEGYASATSVDRTDDSIYLYISAPAPNSSVAIEVFRMGWYGGLGARRVYSVVPPFIAQHQDDCGPQNMSTGLVECHWDQPGNATVQLRIRDFSSPLPDGRPVTGYYLVRLTTPPPPAPPTHQNYILFVVRDDARPAKFLMNSAVSTYQAYNQWGDNSLYTSFPDGGPLHTQVSFDRPMFYGHGLGDFIDPYLDKYRNPNDPNFRWPGGYEYPMVRFLERQGYDVTYATDIDLHARPHLLDNRDAFLSVGHDEYWSKDMHDNLERARDRSPDAGLPTNIAFFSGNSVYWITNIIPNTLLTVPNRIIETHKQTSPPWLWQSCPDVRSGYPNAMPTCSLEERSEQKLVGSVTTDASTDRGDIVFAARDISSPDAGWIFQDISTTSRLPGMIGYESQTVLADKFPVPLGQTVFAQSTFKARPHGLSPETLRADMSLYQPNNGALVVSLGSPDWSLGLDIYTASTGNFPSSIYLRDHPAIPQMTRNILEGVGRLSHVTPQPPIGPGYTVSLIPAATCFNPNDLFTAHISAPSGRGEQQCQNFPWCDAISVYNVVQNDDNDPASKNYILGQTDIPVHAPLVPGTYTADYVTVDRVWTSDYGDPLRTIWRAAKSSHFCVPCPCTM